MKNFMSMFVLFVGVLFGVNASAQSIGSQYFYQSSTPVANQNSQVVQFRYEGSSQIHYYDKVNNTIDGVPQSNRYQGVVQSVQNNQQYYVQQNNQQYYDPNDPRDVRNIQYSDPTSQNNSIRNRMTRLLTGNNGQNQVQNQYQNQPVAYVAPTTQAPGYGYEWRYSQKYNSWGWYNPNVGWQFN